MPVDKFGSMSDAKTKDIWVSLTYINNNYIRSDGGTPVSGSINMNGKTCPILSMPKMWLPRNTLTILEGLNGLRENKTAPTLSRKIWI